MAAVAVPKAPMAGTSSAQVERLCAPWMAAVAVPKAPMAGTSSAHVERLCRPFMEGTKPVDALGWPTAAYDFDDFTVKKQFSKAASTISTEAGSDATPLTTPSASPYNAGAMPIEAPWGLSL